MKYNESMFLKVKLSILYICVWFERKTDLYKFFFYTKSQFFCCIFVTWALWKMGNKFLEKRQHDILNYTKIKLKSIYVSNWACWYSHFETISYRREIYNALFVHLRMWYIRLYLQKYLFSKLWVLRMYNGVFHISVLYLKQRIRCKWVYYCRI